MQFKHYEYRGEGGPPYNQGVPPPTTYTSSGSSYWAYSHPSSHGDPLNSPTSYQPGSADPVYLRDPNRYHSHSPTDYRQGSHHSPPPHGSSHNPPSLSIPGSSVWSSNMAGPSSAPLRHPIESPTAQVHEWTESKNTTLPKAIEPLIIEVPDRSGKRFFCGWIGCNHFGGFVRKAQLVTHIRSVHLCEKPFLCKACDASFTRRQDAVRHVETMNSGKQYKCHYCDEGFARKDYRDRHSDRCKFR